MLIALHMISFFNFKQGVKYSRLNKIKHFVHRLFILYSPLVHQDDTENVDLRRSPWSSQSISLSSVVGRQLRQGSRLRSHLHNGVVWQPDQQHKLLPQPVRGPLVRVPFPRSSNATFGPIARRRHTGRRTRRQDVPWTPPIKYRRTVAPPPRFVTLRFPHRLLSSHDPRKSAIWLVRTA